MSLLSAPLLAVAAQAPQPLLALEPPSADPIVVTGSRGKAGRTEPDAVAVLRAFCFDPVRLTGRFAPPSEGTGWFALDGRARRQFHIADPEVPAFALQDEARRQQLWIKFEALRGRAGLIEKRCTILVIGGSGHRRFVDSMSALFGGTPTQRHVGHQDGSPAVAGWEQWLWTGMPARGAKAWKAIAQPRGAPPTWLTVVDEAGFYRDYDYLLGDMKLRKGPGAPITMLTFSLTSARRP